MPWTDLVSHADSVLALYGSAPSLGGFRLEAITLGGDAAHLRGDFAALPDPLPERWADRGKTRVSVRIDASGLAEAEVSGSPRLRFNGGAGHEGQPVDLSVTAADSTWTAPDGSERPHVVVSGEAEFVSFRFVCESMTVQAWGEEPHVL